MPTIIALDLSLSMLRPASSSAAAAAVTDVDVDEEPQTLFDLAKIGIRSFLNYLEKNSRLEFVSIIGYSSQCDLVCPFTRDFQELREKLDTVDCLDTTNIVAAFKGIVSYVQEQWTNSVPINVIFVSDDGKWITKALFVFLRSASCNKALKLRLVVLQPSTFITWISCFVLVAQKQHLNLIWKHYG